MKEIAPLNCIIGKEFQKDGLGLAKVTGTVQCPRLRDSGEPSPFAEPNELGEGMSPGTQREGSMSQSF